MDEGMRTEKTVLTGFVIDATLSFSTVYAQIYYIIERLMMSLQDAEDKYSAAVRYGVTLIRDRAETLIFGNNEAFSEDPAEVLRRLADIYFYGGGADGSENINDAVTSMLESMADYEASRPEDIKKVILLFTDSIPSDRNMFPDLTDAVQGISTGINAAYLYSYTDEYMPLLRIAGAKGALSETEGGECVFESLETILGWTESEALANMEELAESIMEQVI